MGQVLHGCATTTEAVRRAIQHSQESLRALSKRYGINQKTVAKWKARTSVTDRPTGPKQPRSTVLSIEDEAIVVAFRRHTLLALDDCLYALQATLPHLTRSSLHRCLQRHGISRLPEVEGDKPAKRKFKTYAIGYLHIDIAEVRTAEGKLHLFVAIDRTTKFAFVQLHEKATTRVAGDFLRALIKAVPYRIHTVLTDNGIHFTDPRCPGSAVFAIKQAIAAGEIFRAHAFEYTCAENDIEHRLTKPKHPWTNGQVERMNRTIKDATVKRFHYEAHDQLRAHLANFVDAYNFARRLKTLKGLTPYEAICNHWTKEPERFNLDPIHQTPGLNTYIKSQAHEGWRLVSGRYDDGGLSGASLDRPALRALLDEIRTRRIDIVVVYKVDRLTRSLADFAKLVELFDAHSVSFVSVTQSFNTTSSMGRLTLNVLLSFAQFEREVIGERVPDKIAASKRKGIWVGGPIPLGYRSVDKTLAIVPHEAVAVRTIFNLYLVLKSVGGLVAELERLDITARGGNRFGLGGLAHLLRNRFYIGEVVYRGEVYPGPQEPIVDRATFDAVQARLDAQTVARRHRRAESAGLLTGLLFDERGNRLTPSHTNKKGLRYRYYVSQAVLQNNKGAAGTIARIAAPDIEIAVVSAVRTHLNIDASVADRELVAMHVNPSWSEPASSPSR